MDIEWDDGAMKAMFQEVANAIEDYDAAFRATHQGYPVEVVEADFEGAFPGVELPTDKLREYAEAVSRGEPFEFRLSG